MAANKKLNFAEDFMLSGVAAAVSKTAAAPIERVKLMVQNQDEMIKAGRLKEPYKGVMDCFKRVLAEEGVGPFWRGNLANVIRYFPTQALNFAFKPRFKKLFSSGDPNASWGRKFFENIAAGGAAGASSLVFVYSLDYARTRLANDAKSAKGDGKRQYSGLVDVYKQTFATDGLAGLYRGFPISCVGIVVYRGCYFGFYDSLKPMLGDLSDNFFATFLLGWAVTIAAGLASYPLDTVRRRMMMTSGQAVKYDNALHCARVVAGEGMSSFFKGAGANILRGVAGAGVLSGFDKIKQAYIQMRLGGEDE